MQSRFEPLERHRPSNGNADGEDATVDGGGRHPLVEEAVEAVMQVGGAMMEMVERGFTTITESYMRKSTLKIWSRYVMLGFCKFFWGLVNRNPCVMVYEIKIIPR